MTRLRDNKREKNKTFLLPEAGSHWENGSWAPGESQSDVSMSQSGHIPNCRTCDFVVIWLSSWEIPTA